MKRTIILVICMLLCLAACTKNTPAPQPTAAPEAQVTPEAAQATPEATQEPAAQPEAPTAEPAAEGFNADMVFSGTTLDGEPIDQTVFASYDLIIVNCWAEWCGPCVGELPAIERIHQEYPNVLVLGLLVGTMSVDTAKQTLAENGVTYAALEPVDALEELSMRSMYIPASYFFDKNGNEVGDSVVGGMDYDQWKATVDNLLG